MSERPALLLEALARPGPLVSVELRPPSSALGAQESMSTWIDLHHSLGRIARDGTFVFLTDNAVGAAEEESLAHVGANVAETVDRRRIVPILTCKHSLQYCLTFASRAVSDGFDTLTVLGGDKDVGPPRCVPHGKDLRGLIRARLPGMALGGWVNPHGDPDQQVRHLIEGDAHAEYALSQVVSHHDLPAVERLLAAAERAGTRIPIVFGVFYYRSGSPRTLETLSRFFPVPVAGLLDEFDRGLSADEICARTVRDLRAAGAEKIYVSNLGTRGIGRRLAGILEAV